MLQPLLFACCYKFQLVEVSWRHDPCVETIKPRVNCHLGRIRPVLLLDLVPLVYRTPMLLQLLIGYCT